MTADDVIFALASGMGRASVALIRVSGSRVADLFGGLVDGARPRPRRAELRRLIDPVSEQQIDLALVLWFPAPRSFTGEDVVEFHVHGGRAVIDGVMGVLTSMRGFRPAEAGEFSRRAFRNGKMDLTEAEAIADLIDADTAAARRQALWQLQGGLSEIYQSWRSDLIELVALAEASLDFSDEPIPGDLEIRIRQGAAELRGALDAHLAGGDHAERLRDGLRVVLSGPPNVGKSSLLNALARRDAAIVTDIPGTTRDVLEVKLDLGGYPVTLYDTAGIRDSEDPIEQEGVRRARAVAADADVVIDVRDAMAPKTCAAVGPTVSAAARLVFWNKIDQSPAPVESGGIEGSAKSGEGLLELESALTRLAKRAIDDQPAPAITRARHRAAVRDAAAALGRALEAPAPELAAEDLRLALRALGRVVGVVDVEDVLDRIFGAFCIGK